MYVGWYKDVYAHDKTIVATTIIKYIMLYYLIHYVATAIMLL